MKAGWLFYEYVYLISILELNSPSRVSSSIQKEPPQINDFTSIRYSMREMIIGHDKKGSQVNKHYDEFDAAV